MVANDDIPTAVGKGAKALGLALSARKHLFVRGSEFAALCEAEANDWQEFADCWNNLTLDRFMGDNGRYRYRRYAALRCESGGSPFTVLPHGPYEQPTYVNKLNGGITRIFDPLEDRFLRNPLFGSLLRNLTAIFDSASGVDTATNAWDVRIHPYRIVTEHDKPGMPTPEGLHRDGVDYIVSMMVGRQGVDGGATDVTDAAGSWLTTVCLEEPLDILLSDDAATMHRVSPITSSSTNAGWRDVLVVAYTRL